MEKGETKGENGKIYTPTSKSNFHTRLFYELYTFSKFFQSLETHPTQIMIWPPYFSSTWNQIRLSVVHDPLYVLFASMCKLVNFDHFAHFSPMREINMWGQTFVLTCLKKERNKSRWRRPTRLLEYYTAIPVKWFFSNFHWGSHSQNDRT